MNRIQLCSNKSSDQEDAPHIEQAILRQNVRRGVPHTLFAPLHYEKNYAYPLLVWLHGAGGDERQLQRIMPEISMRNYVAVAPRGGCQLPESERGFAWGDSDAQLVTAEHLIFECIEAARDRFHIADHRVFLGGFECGGTTAFHIGLRNPTRFAGLVSVGGPFPLGRNPLLQLSQARSLPLFIAQGRESLKYPVQRTCDELRLFHVAGLNVTLRQYPCGDELNTQMLHDADVWMMEQVTGVPAVEDNSSSYYFGDSN